MERQEQIDFILDHYEHPYRQGPIEGATVVQRGGNPGCGDVVTFYLKVAPDGRIEDISFEGHGCTISQAAASMVTEMFTGKQLADVEAASSSQIIDLLGREVAGTRPRCATLGLDTVKNAVAAVRRRERLGQGPASGNLNAGDSDAA